MWTLALTLRSVSHTLTDRSGGLQHGYTAFAPHFMHRQCPANAMATEECAVNCIHKGRYCAYDSILGDFAGQFQPRQVRSLIHWPACSCPLLAGHQTQHWQI